MDTILHITSLYVHMLYNAYMIAQYLHVHVVFFIECLPVHMCNCVLKTYCNMFALLFIHSSSYVKDLDMSAH